MVHEVDQRQIKKTGSQDEKTVDTMHQIVYRNLAEELAIYHESGGRAGTINESLTAQLKQIKVEVAGQIDWKATYELRLTARNRVQAEELRRKSKG